MLSVSKSSRIEATYRLEQRLPRGTRPRCNVQCCPPPQVCTTWNCMSKGPDGTGKRDGDTRACSSCCCSRMCAWEAQAPRSGSLEGQRPACSLTRWESYETASPFPAAKTDFRAHGPARTTCDASLLDSLLLQSQTLPGEDDEESGKPFRARLRCCATLSNQTEETGPRTGAARRVKSVEKSRPFGHRGQGHGGTTRVRRSSGLFT